MSITFVSTNAPETLEVNLSNSNAYATLRALGIEPDYCGSVTASRLLDLAFERATEWRYGFNAPNAAIALNVGRLVALAGVTAFADGADPEREMIRWS